MTREKQKTETGEGGPTVLKRLLGEKPKRVQIYGRITQEKFDRLKKLLEHENISMYQAVDVMVDLLFDYYDKEARRLGMKPKL